MIRFELRSSGLTSVARGPKLRQFRHCEASRFEPYRLPHRSRARGNCDSSLQPSPRSSRRVNSGGIVGASGRCGSKALCRDRLPVLRQMLRGAPCHPVVHQKLPSLIGHVRFDERGWETGRRSGVSARAHPRLYTWPWTEIASIQAL